MSEGKEEDTVPVTDIDSIREETQKAVEIIEKTQKDMGKDLDPVFTAVFVNQYLRERFHGQEGQKGHLKGSFMIRNAGYDHATETLQVDVSWMPKIISQQDELIKIIISKDGSLED